jgi:hypothetical protein
MVCPSAMHVVIRFPTCVKMELLSDAIVTVAPIIDAPSLGNESDDGTPEKDPVNTPIAAAPIIAPLVEPVPAQQEQPATVPKRIPFLPGLQLCRQCKYSPYKNPDRRCTGGGHRFEHDPATKKCEKFQFP